jgi:hypothetical protein
MNGKTTGSSLQTELVDIEWVAMRLGVKVRHVRRLVSERRIPFVKWGTCSDSIRLRSKRGSTGHVGRRPIEPGKGGARRLGRQGAP